jgi:hypothetical protein
MQPLQNHSSHHFAKSRPIGTGNDSIMQGELLVASPVHSKTMASTHKCMGKVAGAQECARISRAVIWCHMSSQRQPASDWIKHAIWCYMLSGYFFGHFMRLSVVTLVEFHRFILKRTLPDSGSPDSVKQSLGKKFLSIFYSWNYVWKAIHVKCLSKFTIVKSLCYKL